jgi:apolipoprotein N-acyltransferase
MVELESLSLSVELLLGGNGLRLLFFFFLALGWLLPELSEDGELDCRLLFSGRLFWLLSAFLALLPRLCFFLPRVLYSGNRMISGVE